MKYLWLSVIFVFACTKPLPPLAPQAQVKIESEGPRRIILFIGDGMGVGAITAASYKSDKKLQMLELSEFGWMSTHSAEFLVTDSAASASAIASGKKTHFNGIGVVSGTSQDHEEDSSTHLESILDLAKKRGRGIGVVSTARVVHATPGAFYAHRSTRKSYEKIAEDLLRFEPDVVLGGGWKYFRERKDNIDLSAKLKTMGYDYIEDAKQLEKEKERSKKLVGLFIKKDMPFIAEGTRSVSLSDMVDSAIKVLDRGHPKGWVLMVEGSFIDWCEHALRPGCTIKETLDFDDAIGVARRYSAPRKDTLLIATSDHETGGLSVIDPIYAARFSKRLKGSEDEINLRNAVIGGSNKQKDIRSAPIQHFGLGKFLGSANRDLEDPRMTTAFGSLSVASGAMWKGEGRFFASHSANFVPIFAEGVGAEYVAASGDNAMLGTRIKETIMAFQSTEKTPTKIPKNIVLFIGDGMGIPSVTANYYAQGASNMMSLPKQGMVATQATNRLVADSAATGSTLSTGVLMPRGAIAFNGRNQETLIEKALKENKSVGIITNVPITHATPAAFYAHQDSRKKTAEIAMDLVNFKKNNGKRIDLILGGGLEDIEAHIPALEKQGYEVALQWPPKTKKDIIGVFAKKALPAASEKKDPNNKAPTLSEMIEFAIERLSKNKKGFILVVEGGQIDWRLHELNRGQGLLDELAEFDKSVGFMKKIADEETLFVVTADHDHTMSVIDNHYAFAAKRCGAAKQCGGTLDYLELPVGNVSEFSRQDLQGDFSPPKMILQYAWLIRAAQKESFIKGSHSANFVPLFAKGPGSDGLVGFHTQVEIGKLLSHYVQGKLGEK